MPFILRDVSSSNMMYGSCFIVLYGDWTISTSFFINLTKISYFDPWQEEASAIKASGKAWYQTMISDSDYTEFENFSKWLGVSQWFVCALWVLSFFLFIWFCLNCWYLRRKRDGKEIAGPLISFFTPPLCSRLSCFIFSSPVLVGVKTPTLLAC